MNWVWWALDQTGWPGMNSRGPLAHSGRDGDLGSWGLPAEAQLLELVHDVVVAALVDDQALIINEREECHLEPEGSAGGGMSPDGSVNGPVCVPARVISAARVEPLTTLQVTSKKAEVSFATAARPSSGSGYCGSRTTASSL